MKAFLKFTFACMLIGSSCGRTEFGMKMSLQFYNDTDSTLVIQIREPFENDLVLLLPHTNTDVFEFDIHGGGESPKPESCCQEFLIDIFGSRSFEGNSTIIQVNDLWCVTHVNDRSMDIGNYDYDILSKRHFKYTYHFTQSDINDAILCE